MVTKTQSGSTKQPLPGPVEDELERTVAETGRASVTWDTVARLREQNRAIYKAIEELVGVRGGEDPTLKLMQSFYTRYPVLAQAVHRDILKRDLLIYDNSTELAWS